MSDNIAVGSVQLELLEDDSPILLQEDECPECWYSPIIIEGHCKTCPKCGWSLCTN